MPCDERHLVGLAPVNIVEDPVAAARNFEARMATRRSVRDFATTPVDPEVVRAAIGAAASAPSGAHVQPWRFVVVADPALRKQIRDGAEEEERAFYASRASAEWLDALASLGTDPTKGHLTDAALLIVVFEVHRSDTEARPYYATESVGIAVGILLSALHHSGLSTLTHTPSPMKFLNQILGRPANERAFAVIPVGHAVDGAMVPKLTRKPLDEVMVWL